MRCALFVFALVAATTHAQWEMQSSGTTASLRGIDNVGNGVAWASGTGGTVLHTEDGGKHWLSCAVPPDAEKLDFRGVQAFNAKIAIVMSSGKGNLSRLYKTTDGCATWKLVFTNPDKDGFWDALRFDKVSIARGSVVGDPVGGAFVIFSTNDQGNSWMRWQSTSFEPSIEAMKGESLFAASNSSSGGEHVGGIFSFVTGGSSGSRYVRVITGESAKKGLNHIGLAAMDLPFAKSEPSGAFSLGVTPEGNVMIVGGDYSKPSEESASVYRPFTNGLKSRSVASASGKTHGYRSAVAYDATTRTWITVGPNGTDVSTDDGRNWRALLPATDDAPDTDKNWNALSLPFVVGPKGRIGVLRAETLKPK